MEHLCMEQRFAAAAVYHCRGLKCSKQLILGMIAAWFGTSGDRQRHAPANPRGGCTPVFGNDGVHIGRPPAGSPTRPAQTLMS